MLNWFRALLPREDRFFDLFERHARTLVEGAGSLQRLLEGGDGVAEHALAVMAFEQQADDVTREVLVAVRRTFITPFDRGNIQTLIQAMDDAIDQMQKAAKKILLFEVTSFDPLMREMAAGIVEAARITAEAVPLLSGIATHADRLNGLTEAIVTIEGRVDSLHDEGLKQLYHGRDGRNPQPDAMAYIVGSEIYGHLESVMDRFEDVANEIAGIVIENV